MKDGHDVLALDNLSSGNLDNLPKSQKITFIRIDLAKWGNIVKRFNYFNNIDAVFHLAAYSRVQPSIDHPETAFDNNLYGTYNLLKIMRLKNINKIIYSSTSAAYGLKNSSPALESMHPDCLSPYSATKVGAELLINAFGTSYRYTKCYS